MCRSLTVQLSRFKYRQYSAYFVHDLIAQPLF